MNTVARTKFLTLMGQSKNVSEYYDPNRPIDTWLEDEEDEELRARI